MKRIIISLLAMSFYSSVWTQVELANMGLDKLLQGDRFNPAVLDVQYEWSLGLPSIYYNAHHTGEGFKNIIDVDGPRPLLKVQALYEGLTNDNALHTEGEIQTFKIRYDNQDWSMGFEHRMRLQASVWYPDALIQLYVDGNQQWIGEEVALGPDVRSSGFNSYEFTFNYRKDNWAIGVRPRYLSGNYFMQTPRTLANLYTDPDFYEVTLTTDYTLENAGILSFEDANLLDYKVNDFGRWKLFSPNHGWALDLGLKIRPADNVTVGISMIDWGRLNWTEEVRTYSSQRVTEYSGTEILDLVGTQEINIEGVIDSLRLLFDVGETSRSISYSLPSILNGSVHYRPSDMWYLALMASYREGLVDPLAVGLQLGFNLSQQWSVGTTLSHRYGEANVGLQTAYTGRNVSGFLILGNLLNGINPLTSNRFSLAAGVNLHWSSN